MVGERGGGFETFEAASALLHTFKDDWAAAVRADILQHLEHHAEWHRDDLQLILPPDSKNVLGAVVNGLVRSGRIEETGERRASAEPAAHGRRSNVYKTSGCGYRSRTDRNVKGLRSVRPDDVRGGGDGRSQTQTCASEGQPTVISPTGEPGGSRLDETAVAPTLFQLDPDPPPAPGHVDLDQREAA